MSNEDLPHSIYFEVDGRKLFPGDSVVVLNVLAPKEEPTKYLGVEHLRAVYMGSYNRDPEQEPIPLIALILSDGKTEHYWSDECNWTHPESYKEYCEWFEIIMQSPNN